MRSNRGFIKAVAVVTKRIKALDVDGKEGAYRRHSDPLGLQGRGEAGLHRQHADAVRWRRQSQTPEFKAFLVDIEKV